MSDTLHIDVSELGDVSDDIYNLKSPDRSKTWKASRLKRSKTYSGSPSNKIGIMSTEKSSDGSTDKVAPLSPVNQRKWNKTNMKRRSSNARLTKSFSDKQNTHILGMEHCLSLSTLKVSVKMASEISKNAIGHRYSCQCKQYLDTCTGILYSLDANNDYDSNIIEETSEDVKRENLNRESAPSVQTHAENTKAEIITSNLPAEFNFNFQHLDDNIAELLKLINIKPFSYDGVYSKDCCYLDSVQEGIVSSAILKSMKESGKSLIHHYIYI